jgi:hypothetical protein
LTKRAGSGSVSGTNLRSRIRAKMSRIRNTGKKQMDNNNKNTEKPSCLVGDGADWWRTACTGSRTPSAAPCTWPAAAAAEGSAGSSPPYQKWKRKIHTHPRKCSGHFFFSSNLSFSESLHPGSGMVKKSRSGSGMNLLDHLCDKIARA